VSPGAGDGVVAAWMWKRVPEPALAPLPAQVQRWELKRYWSYRQWLADRPVGEAFGRAAAFLNLAAARVASAPDTGLLANH